MGDISSAFYCGTSGPFVFIRLESLLQA